MPFSAQARHAPDLRFCLWVSTSLTASSVVYAGPVRRHPHLITMADTDWEDDERVRALRAGIAERDQAAVDNALAEEEDLDLEEEGLEEDL